MKDLKKVGNYKHVLFCTSDLRRKYGKAIDASTLPTMHSLYYAINLTVAEDETTWDGVEGDCYTRVKGPPQWHKSLEVEDNLQTLPKRQASPTS
jgi:hypothetical protein